MIIENWKEQEIDPLVPSVRRKKARRDIPWYVTYRTRPFPRRVATFTSKLPGVHIQQKGKDQEKKRLKEKYIYCYKWDCMGVWVHVHLLVMSYIVSWCFISAGINRLMTYFKYLKFWKTDLWIQYLSMPMYDFNSIFSLNITSW